MPLKRPKTPEPSADLRKSQREYTKVPAQDDTFDCRSCEEPDSVDDMVQCDQCNGWNHFRCAGVNHSIENKTYICHNCTGKSRPLSSFSETYTASVVRLVNETPAASIIATQSQSSPPSLAVVAEMPPVYDSCSLTSASLTIAADTTSCTKVTATSAAETMAKSGLLSSVLRPTYASTFAAPITAARIQGPEPVSAPSAAEVAANRGRAAPCFGTSHTSTLAAHMWSPEPVSAPSAAEVAAKRGRAAPCFGTSHTSTLAAHTRSPVPSAPEVTARRGRPAPCFGSSHTSRSASQMIAVHELKHTSVSEFNAAEVAVERENSLTARDTHSTKKGSKGSSSSRSSKSSTNMLKIELQKIEEEMQLREDRDKEELRLRKEREAEYLNKKYKIVSQMIDSSDEDDEVACEFENKNPKENIYKWIAGVPEKKNYLHSTTNVGSHPFDFIPAASQQLNTTWNNGVKGADTRQQSFRTSVMTHELKYPQSQSGVAALNPTKEQSTFTPPANEHNPTVNFSLPSQLQEQPYVQPLPQLPPFLSTSQHAPSNYILTKSHLAARHLIRDLPTFDGKPSEWPLFIASYNRSTELGGFSNEENLIRLHKALKGDALKAVKSLIIQPNCVGRVIETLRMLYGRPELIINTLIREINSTPSPKADKLETIVTFAIAVQNLCATFEVSGIFNNLNYPTLLQELVDKLPPTLRLNWAIHKRSLPICTLADFNIWIYAMGEAANGVLRSAPTSSTDEKNHRNQNWKNKGVVNTHYKDSDQNFVKSENKCCICGSSCASVAVCKQFLQINRTARWAEVRKHQLCSKCLKRHLHYKCTSDATCGKNNCVLKHHQLLHKDQPQVAVSSGGATVGVHSENCFHSQNFKTDSVLFRILPVVLYGNGVQVEVFAFLDDGSSVTLLDEEIAKQLNLKGEKRPLCLKWTGNTSRLESQSELINLQISSTKDNAEKFQLANVHTVQKLALPAQTLNRGELQMKFEHLKGFSVDSYNKAVPRLLIGVNNAQLGHPLKSKEGGWNEPIATKTRLGWVVHGSCSEEANNHIKTQSFHICDCNDLDLRRLINDFICDDNFGTSGSENVSMSQDDTRALELLNTHTVHKNGRFETTLLWKFDEIKLPDSFPMARRRLQCLQKRMSRNPELGRVLDTKIKEYVAKGYARKVTDQEIAEHQNRSWYLPIFPVENINKPGKIRIVWDAAATVQGTSLNSVLLKGPDQLTPLTSVIYKFRQHKIAISGDIKEMFHQIKIRTADQHFQRFLWGSNEEGRPDTYIMAVMTFGASCSPSTAHYVKNTNAERFSAEYPRAVLSIKENHYVDDLMDSVPTEEEAVKLAQEIRHIHKQGGFHIRNWVSNSAHVLKALESEPTEQMSMNVSAELGIEKVLGMWWCTSLDCLTFKLTSNPNQREVLFGLKRPTKRDVLRVMMTIFDPLGLIACFLMYIKILLQDVWRSKIEWDDTIKEEEYKKWIKWINILPMVETVKIPRCYITFEWGSEIELHMFVDASENGYAAVAYVRNVNKGLIETTLIGGKTRVAPLKSLSIPRLELQAALLGVRFAKTITESHGICFNRRFFWSDSKTVLCWLRSDHRRYRQFVAFRVSEILDLSATEEWRWVPTRMNVADEATKWQRPPDLKPTSRWFNGPKFLKLSLDNWPAEKVTSSTIEELKTNFLGVHTRTQKPTYRSERFSKWKKLLRSTAYVHRFIRNTSTKRTKLPKMSGHFTSEELQIAENNLLLEAQISEYAEEIADLTMNRKIQKSSPILNLNPFLDQNNIIRANGRICFAEGVEFDSRHPIILPRWHQITSLIIEDVHSRYRHQNDETVVNVLRQRFYISHIRSALKFVKKSCQECKNNKVQPSPPIMAPLPPARLGSFCRPFSYVGVDYFGPITVSLGRRTEKRWGVLFTCLTIRAIHIEVAHTLTTDSCILCLRNFIARRGTPIELHSDNGTNFHGAERELREASAAIQKDKLIETFTSTTTQWKFIPPGSPHMGGSWERLVRSVKTVLYAIAPTRNPNDELLRSMLIEIENIVNSRPLTYIPIAPENPEALTPNHFLLGSAYGSKPSAHFNDDVIWLRKNWLVSQQFADRFWKRWVAEYLPTLTRRSKWFTSVKSLEVGDIVLVVDPNSPRNSWPKGRIIKVKLSNDGQVRSATIQTQSGIYERPAVKLAVLDIKAPEDNSPEPELPRGSVSANAP